MPKPSNRRTVWISPPCQTGARIRLPSILDDLVVPGIFDIDCNASLCVPQAPDFWLRPLLPGDFHTLEKSEHVKDMVAMFHVTGILIYADSDGVSVYGEDVFSRLDEARRHYEAI
ncbi:Putative rmlC-like jelly roll protein [Colletotrichum destructivum]|uniref:RmlC-like jelly roll protein n=1 Tax=Colletotrichum destructivum TaxID=34406 RepID=A0AAX4IEU1_9PEZI|nr:Putative rmlC-like jelly roll protein [Colletotrichum destructivum]